MISVLLWFMSHAYEPCEPTPGRPRVRVVKHALIVDWVQW